MPGVHPDSVTAPFRPRHRAWRPWRDDGLWSGSGPGRERAAVMRVSGPGAGVIGEFADPLGQLAGDDVVEGDLIEDGPFVGAQRDPDALQRLRRANVAEVLRALTAHSDKLPVHGADDVRERDLAGGLRQPEPTLGAALAAHKPRPAQLGENRLKELRRNVLRPCQLLGRGVITTGGR